MVEGQTCADKTRLNVHQTNFDPVIEFDFKSFRYDGSVTTKENDKELLCESESRSLQRTLQFLYQNKQKQLLTCSLRLDQSEEIQKTEPVNCSCYDEINCEGLF